MSGKKCEMDSSKLLSYEKNPKVHREKKEKTKPLNEFPEIPYLQHVNNQKFHKTNLQN